MKKYGSSIVALIMGVLLLVLGIFTLFNTDTTPTFVYVFGIVSILFGLAEIIVFFVLVARTDYTPAISLIMGILNIMMGIMLISNVWLGAMALSFLFPFWMIFLCVSRLFNLGAIKRISGNGAFWLSLIVNVLGIIAGFALMFFPGISMVTVSLFIGMYLLLAAVEMIVFAVRGIQLARKL